MGERRLNLRLAAQLKGGEGALETGPAADSTSAEVEVDETGNVAGPRRRQGAAGEAGQGDPLPARLVKPQGTGSTDGIDFDGVGHASTQYRYHLVPSVLRFDHSFNPSERQTGRAGWSQ